MKTKLTNSDLILLVRLQHTLNKHIFNNPTSDYNMSLQTICKSIEDFFINHVYYSHTSFAYHRELQKSFDRILASDSYDEYLSFLRRIFNKNNENNT